MQPTPETKDHPSPCGGKKPDLFREAFVSAGKINELLPKIPVPAFVAGLARLIAKKQ